MAVNGMALGVAAVGAAFLYGGVKNKSVFALIQSTVRGAAPGTVPTAASSGPAPNANYSSGGQQMTGPQRNAGATANQALGKMLAQPYGWSSGQEWADLVSLWDRESGWSNTADTRVSGAGGDNMQSAVFAYGIAQARPATKYPLPGQPPDLGGQADPATQIRWGLQYIQGTYGDPSTAWAHETSAGWY